MTTTERNQIKALAAEAEGAIRDLSKKPGRRERIALRAIDKIKEVAGV